MGFDAKIRNLGSHQHCIHAIGYAQSNAFLEGRHGTHILTGNVFENLATTSKIYHLLPVEYASACASSYLSIQAKNRTMGRSTRPRLPMDFLSGQVYARLLHVPDQFRFTVLVIITGQY